MNILSSYKNGSINVTIFDDGTKIRAIDGDNIYFDFPESIDVKITNYCTPEEDNPICAYCHEKSNVNGKHGDLKSLQNVLSQLPAGVEIACGGGDTLSHPDIVPFLEAIKQQGLIANLTINEKHLKKHNSLLSSLIKKNLIKGIGVSYTSRKYFNDIKPILELSSNVVFHLIMGINQIVDIDDLICFSKDNNRECKILLLGYKQYGLGLNYYIKNKNIEDNKYQWYIKLPKFFKNENLILSFDNLAINQLNLQRFFSKKGWDIFYMGDDFTHSIYIDAVNQQFAPSSTSNNRKLFNETTLINYFKNKS
jgi:organic radical activating enzyme